MPVQTTYPGVYIEEVPSGVRTLVGVATSITAFIGRALRGPVDEPVTVQNFGEFARRFGGVWVESTLGYAMQQFFLNGGGEAVIVRVHNGAQIATLNVSNLFLRAIDPGAWGSRLRAWVDHDTADPGNGEIFNLFVAELNPALDAVVVTEEFRNVSVKATDPRYVRSVVDEESRLVRIDSVLMPVPGTRPAASIKSTTVPPDPTGYVAVAPAAMTSADGAPITDAQIAASTLQGQRRGLWALEKADIFNLLCIPPLTRITSVNPSTLGTAAEYCRLHRAMLIVDPPFSWNTPDDAVTGLTGLNLAHTNAALYFPTVRMADSERENRLEEFAPCGVVAGVIARTDAQRGVWKAPAGQDASLVGVRELTYRMTDGENGRLNPLGINALRTFPVVGSVVWGARTLRGADALSSEWKYLPVRRLALYIEESLFRGTKWVVFEPNDEPLWSQIRLNVGSFMHGLFRQGAFQGGSPREAYLVKCDSETTTQADINLGIVNIVVGFAPLKPAEFVIIKIQQLAGRLEA